MSGQRTFKYQLSQPRDSYNLATVHRDSQLYESERSQPTISDRDLPPYTDVYDARRNESPPPIYYVPYSTNTNRDESNLTQMQQFTTANEQRTDEDTQKNKKTKQPNNSPQSSRSSRTHGYYSSSDNSWYNCFCCFNFNEHHNHGSTADHHDNCCDCDGCDGCGDCSGCDGCGDCGGCDGCGDCGGCGDLSGFGDCGGCGGC